MTSDYLYGHIKLLRVLIISFNTNNLSDVSVLTQDSRRHTQVDCDCPQNQIYC